MSEIENDVYQYITVNDREIVVSNEIDSPLCQEICIALRRIEASIIDGANKYNSSTPPPIVLRLQTWGGELHPALGVVDLIEALSVEVIVEINGYCASAGTLISSAADYVVMNPRAFILVHQLSSYVSGKRSEMIDHGKQIEAAHRIIIDLYKKKTGLSKKKIKRFLDRESWMTAQEAKDNGFVDEIGVMK